MIEPLWTGEHLSLVRDETLGLRAAIAIDSTTLGPALGGVRFAAYESLDAAAIEAQRLASVMTLKNAAADLPYGGGKSVIIAERPVTDRTEFFRRFGDFVSRLGGTYLPGVDMGTSAADLKAIGAAGAEVSCDDDDPSPWTALGVLHAMTAAVQVRLGQSDLTGLTVLIQGAGHVGAHLARNAAALGGRVLVSDIDSARARAVARTVGGAVIEPDSVLDTPCDVFAPSAKAQVISPVIAASLQTKIVAGAANDVLTDDTAAAVLAERGIAYVPDFIANAGGVIHIHALRASWTTEQLTSAVEAIGERATAVLTTPEPPLTAARDYAATVLAGRSTARLAPA